MGQFRSMKMSQELGETESLVINRPVRLGDDHVVIVELASSLEMGILERFEVELTGFLRKTLQNDNIKLEKEVNTPDQSKKLYTSKDKYEYMVKQNPALKDLKDRLGLDFDY